MFEEKVSFAKKWFKENNVQIPTGAKEWQSKSVRRKEIPPGCAIHTLRKNNINVSDFIAALLGVESKKVNYNPVTMNNCIDRCGLKWLSYIEVKGHKKVTVECCKCRFIETVDYGTLQRIHSRNDKYCRLCRGVGGKNKPSHYYGIDGFSILEIKKEKVLLECNECNNLITRGLHHVKTSDYLKCEYCYPNSTTRVMTDLGEFDSLIEYTVYKYLLTIFSEEDILRQPLYKELFEEISSYHRGDFYIIPLDILLEVTTKSNNISKRHKDTLVFKQNVSEIIKVVRSLQEVKDIVRPLMKVNG